MLCFFVCTSFFMSIIFSTLSLAFRNLPFLFCEFTKKLPQGMYRIHWAAPFVSQYVNNFLVCSFMVNQMDTQEMELLIRTHPLVRLLGSGIELDVYFDSIRNGWWNVFCSDIHFYGAENEWYRQAFCFFGILYPLIIRSKILSARLYFFWHSPIV